MKLVQHILERKGNEIWTISPDATVLEALKLMAEKEIGALLVLESGKVTGIISERDYARKVVLKGRTSKDSPVKEIMSGKVIYVNPSTSVEDCMVLMINKRVRHLPVFDNEELVGLISIGDVVKEIIDEKEVVIDELVRYITGRR
ncbi:MAG TPA: CBS domain-containing protein [Ignavibacteriaceae bacterium]|nr:CBS domain-containing protein [Ignavibacteriaceae bacterium]